MASPLLRRLLLLHRGVVAPVRRRLFAAAAADPANRTQVYVSKSTDPYVNLALEAFLLRRTAPESRALLVYRNKPCVVLGRNQNAWTEAAPALLQDGVALVRRASGGGAVFHDRGNVNYAALGPRAEFTRAAAAQLVAGALRRLGAGDARVTERHDIDAGGKVSGSAYKLTRTRALHHGTCLTATADRVRLAAALCAPAAPFVVGRGVASVRAERIGAVAARPCAVTKAIVREWEREYGRADLVVDVTPEELSRLPREVETEWRKLRSAAWVYGESPLFTLSTHPTVDDPRDRPPVPFAGRVEIQVRRGIVTGGHFAPANAPTATPLPLVSTQPDHVPVRAWEVKCWAEFLAQVGVPAQACGAVGPWLDGVMGTNAAGVSAAGVWPPDYASLVCNQDDAENDRALVVGLRRLGSVVLRPGTERPTDK